MGLGFRIDELDSGQGASNGKMDYIGPYGDNENENGNYYSILGI